jgi:hypothetical protein
MIGVHLSGRFGNQMFQYAFAINESIKSGSGFFMIESYFFPFYLSEFFELKRYPAPARKLRKLYFNLFHRKAGTIEFAPASSYAENQKMLGRDNCMYSGYFQSEHYFKDAAEAVKKEFTIRKKHRINARELLGLRSDKPILAVHIRRTDYLTHGDESLGGTDLSLPLTYYQECLSRVDNIKDYNLVFVSDDPEFVKSHFGYLDPLVSSGKNAIHDFQMLMQADALIIANSSFSWWGAYLNPNHPRVFAPRFWMGFRVKKDYPKDIIPPGWEQVEFAA